MSSRNVLWAAFSLFVAGALYLNWHGGIPALAGPLAGVKLLVWGLFAAFLAYTVYCSSRENLFRSLRKVAELHWGRQVGVDLYLGLLLALFIVYLNEGPVAALLWALPTLAFANLSILLYFAIHFDSLVAKFLT